MARRAKPGRGPVKRKTRGMPKAFPCLCGGVAVVKALGGNIWFRIDCRSCKRTSEWNARKEETIKVWLRICHEQGFGSYLYIWGDKRERKIEC
jgi:transcription elongation factor Elf1